MITIKKEKPETRILPLFLFFFFSKTPAHNYTSDKMYSNTEPITVIFSLWCLSGVALIQAHSGNFFSPAACVVLL